MEMLQNLTIPVDPKLPNMVTNHHNIGDEPTSYILCTSNTNLRQTMSEVQYKSA